MSKTKICAIVNVTPDSFSDGGHFYDANQAITHGIDLVGRGAEVLDIGGESTRPGSDPVDNQEEISRIKPVIEALKEQTQAELSVDTWKAEVAEAAIAAGADIINDITGMVGDPQMAQVIAEGDVKVIAMFNPTIARPNHPSSQKFRDFGGKGVFTQEELNQMANMPIVDCMLFYFDKVMTIAESYGISRSKVILDPGIGFGLTKQENYKLINSVSLLHERGHEVFLGVSRKRFVVNSIGKLGLESDPSTEVGFLNRDIASSIITAYATHQEVEYVRVHSIDEHLIARAITHNILHSDSVDDEHFDQYEKKN